MATLEVFPQGQWWTAYYTDECKLVPTAFSTAVPADEVRAKMQELNPDYDVVIRDI